MHPFSSLEPFLLGPPNCSAPPRDITPTARHFARQRAVMPARYVGHPQPKGRSSPTGFACSLGEPPLPLVRLPTPAVVASNASGDMPAGFSAATHRVRGSKGRYDSAQASNATLSFGVCAPGMVKTRIGRQDAASCKSRETRVQLPIDCEVVDTDVAVGFGSNKWHLVAK